SQVATQARTDRHADRVSQTVWYARRLPRRPHLRRSNSASRRVAAAHPVCGRRRGPADAQESQARQTNSPATSRQSASVSPVYGFELRRLVQTRAADLDPARGHLHQFAERDLRITEQRVTQPGVVEKRCVGFRALKNGLALEAFGEEFSREARGDL